MINWANFISQCFNGLVLGALLALIASGLTIIYGTLGVLNLAHGAMFMLGGYAGYLAFAATGSFALAVATGALVLVELVRLAFGSLSLTVPPPAWAAGVTPLGFLIYPTYRIVVLVIAAVALALLYVILYRTRIGMVVRAG